MTVKDDEAMIVDVQDVALNEVNPMDEQIHEDNAMEDQVVANGNQVVTEAACSGDQVVSNVDDSTKETDDSPKQVALLNGSTQPQVVTFNISLQGMCIMYSIFLGSSSGVGCERICFASSIR